MSLSCGTPIYINFCSCEIFLYNLPGEFYPFIKVSLTVCCFPRFKVRHPADRSTAYTLYTDVTLSMCDAHTHSLTLKHTHAQQGRMSQALQRECFWHPRKGSPENAWKHVLLHSDRVSEQCVSCSGISQLTVDREIR